MKQRSCTEIHAPLSLQHLLPRGWNECWNYFPDCCSATQCTTVHCILLVTVDTLRTGQLLPLTARQQSSGLISGATAPSPALWPGSAAGSSGRPPHTTRGQGTPAAGHRCRRWDACRWWWAWNEEWLFFSRAAVCTMTRWDVAISSSMTPLIKADTAGRIRYDSMQERLLQWGKKHFLHLNQMLTHLFICWSCSDSSIVSKLSLYFSLPSRSVMRSAHIWHINIFTFIPFFFPKSVFPNFFTCNATLKIHNIYL